MSTTENVNTDTPTEVLVDLHKIPKVSLLFTEVFPKCDIVMHDGKMVEARWENGLGVYSVPISDVKEPPNNN